ncbi:MAG: hypothetical protein ACM3ZT_01405 [Bacillota bacterium]
MVGAAIPVFACAPVWAAPEEIQVYIDDMTPPGNFGTDVHNNYVVSGSSVPDYPGAEAPEHVYRLTPEFYYGATDDLELGAYLLTTTQSGESPHFDGAKLRIKFIAPHDDAAGAFWGANLEIGDTSLRVSPEPWGTELKGIWGYRAEPWLFAVNTNLDWTSTRVFGGPVSLDVDTKLAWRTAGGWQVGFESYNELGPASDLGHFSRLSETLYGVIDTDLGKRFDLNAGIGRGLTPGSDRWILKFILGIHYD